MIDVSMDPSDKSSQDQNLLMDFLRQLASRSQLKEIEPAWDRTGTGIIKPNYKNAITAMYELGIDISRDMFRDVTKISDQPGYDTLGPDYTGHLTDNALTHIRLKVQNRFGFDVGADMLSAAVAALAEKNRFNPIEDWLDNLKWDGVPRLDSWLPQATGSNKSSLNKEAGALIIKAMVARARYPGSKFDYCIVFEGPQGGGKSTLVRSISSGPGDYYFTDAPGLIGMDNKERAELITGKWIVELAELSGLARSESEGVKAFLSQSSDRYRAPYARVPVDRPRRCIFIGTTNSCAYLSDSTGNRRFIPIKCGKIDLISLEKNREQIFSEADHLLKEKMKLLAVTASRGQPLPHKFNSDFLSLPSSCWQHAANAAEQRRMTDPLEEAVCTVVANLKSEVQILPNGRKFVASSKLLPLLRLHLQGNFNASGLAGWMEKIGWQSATIGPKQARVRGYVHK